MTNSHAILRLRPDLVHRKIWTGGKPIWVVKDPLARSFFHFDEQEHAMLSLADGNRSLAGLCDRAAQLFKPKHLWPEQVVLFFSEAQAKGLLVTDAVADLNDNSCVLPQPWWRNPLAIRVKGFDPTGLLDAIEPFLRPMLSKLAVTMFGFSMIIASMIVLTRFGDLVSHVAIAASRVENLLVLMGVIGVTKLVHEFSHALACRRFGGQCNEMGVMFLVGVPCLYCDVSDAWMIERPWKRMMVSAAGIFSELTLAALATFVWVATIDGPVRDICVTVMVVCSVSTVLLNGNPLLRYDGYYLLSDAIGMPNLAARSKSLLSQRLKQFLWGLPETSAYESSETPLRRRLLMGYAILSGVYRVFVYGLLATVFYFGADNYGLGAMASFAVVAIATGMLGRILKTIFSPPNKTMRRSVLSPGRPAIVSAIIVVAVMFGLTIPLPRSVVAPAITGPRDAEPIVVSNAGIILDAFSVGETVQSGETVARLSNHSMEEDRVALETQRDRLQIRLMTLRDRRGFDRDASAAVPSTSRALEETIKQLELLQRDLDRLQLKIESGGVVFASTRIAEMPSSDWDVRGWAGTPLDRSNRGAHLDAGTEVCVIGDATDREAVVYLRQQDIELVRIGQRVVFRVADRPRGTVTGRVIAVGASPATRIPESLIQSGWIAPATVDSRNQSSFPVRIRVDSQAVPLPVRMIALAQIEVDSASLTHRLKRLASHSFD